MVGLSVWRDIHKVQYSTNYYTLSHQQNNTSNIINKREYCQKAYKLQSKAVTIGFGKVFFMARQWNRCADTRPGLLSGVNNDAIGLRFMFYS